MVKYNSVSIFKLGRKFLSSFANASVITKVEKSKIILGYLKEDLQEERR